MKKTHIIGIIVIAIAIGAIFATLSDSNTYADFAEAFQNPDNEYHVVGKLDKQKEMVYDPHVNPNQFRFYMKDNKGNEYPVILNKPKPQDFERCEQIVIIGKATGETFVANEILMKCPSKYNDGKPQETVSN